MASKIKVDNIENQCGGAVVTKCGATTTISGSVVKADDIQAADGGNIINQCGTNITLGASGDTISLAAGASQTGFGRTGTVDWQTTPKTANFTAVNGEGYFVNTTSGAVTMTMPSGSAGAIVSIQDYNKTFDSNSFTITPASGEKINGGTADGDLLISTEGQGVTFVYVDSTVGWKTVHENEFTAGGSSFISASGGTESTCGDYKIHTFTGPGTFTVSTIGAPTSNELEYLVVAGGGGGGADAGGGAGAGGFRFAAPSLAPTTYPAKPLAAPAGITAAAQAYPIVVGGGGTNATHPDPGTNDGGKGVNSTFSTITSAGGGGGGNSNPVSPYGDGGSGGGTRGTGTKGAGNTPPVSPPQGRPGGHSPSSPTQSMGGGGGAIATGSDGPGPRGGDGGNGGGFNGTVFGGNGQCSSCVRYFSGGGGGGHDGPGSPDSSGGLGGGGAGKGRNNGNGVSGTANTGGGGGAGGNPGTSGTGGSGIVVIRYKFQ